MNKTPSQTSRLNHENDFLSIRDILTVLFKHKREIFAIFVFFTILSFIVPRMMTPIYQAESSLMVKIGREHMFNTEVGDQAPKMGFDLQALIDPEIEILTSRDLSLKVLEVLGVDTIYPDILENASLTISPLEVALINFQENLSINKSGKSNVIKVTFEHPNPQLAARAVNLLSELWKEKHLAIFSNPQAAFLEDQVKEYRRKLDESETVLQQFKRDHGISSILEQRRLLLEQRQNLDSILKSNENQVQGLGTKIKSLQGQLKRIPQNIPLSTVNEQQHQMLDNAKSELLALQRKEQELLRKYVKGSRMVTDIREEVTVIQTFIKEQESQLKDQVTSGRNPLHQDLRLQLINAESELSSLETKNVVALGQIKELESQIARLNQLEKEFDGLQREVNKDQENVKMYLGKFERAHVSKEMDNRQMANVSVIQSASTPIAPIKPRKSLTLYLGMAFGLLSGMAWAFMSDFFKGGYTRPEKASHEQGIPVLASISYKS
jgi:uncharacterized protein involved in exopolysaccharide biosynthesis